MGTEEAKHVLTVDPHTDDTDYDSEVSEIMNATKKTKCVFFTDFLKFLMIGIVLATPLIVLTNLSKDGWIENLLHSPLNESIKGGFIRLFTWIVSTYTIFVLFVYFVGFVPKIVIVCSRIFSGNPSEITKQRLEFYIALVPTLRNTFIICLGMLFWAIIYKTQLSFNEKEKIYWYVYVLKCLACLTVAALIISFEKVIVKLMALKFHRTAYKDRLKQSKYESRILDKLNSSRKRSYIKSPTNGTKPFAFYESKHNTASNLSLNKENSTNIFSSINHTFFEGKYGHDTDLNSKYNAKRLAKKLFSSLNGERNLIVDDFLPYFETKKEAIEAFECFDKDSNGDISRRELKEKIIQIYKERKDLSVALQDMSDAVGKLDKLMITFFSFFILLVWTLIFGKNLVGSLVPFGTLFLGLSFIFGNTAKNVFESIIFLFIMHPFDSGDKVYIEKESYIVSQMGLLGTTFERGDGQYIYIPNSILTTKLIHNARRSEYQAEQIDFQLSFNTPKEQIFKLKLRICKYLEDEESREFYPNPIFALDKIDDSNKLHLFIWLEHKGNWQDSNKRWSRKTRFMIALKEICQDLGLGYIPLPQPVCGISDTISTSTNELNTKRT